MYELRIVLGTAGLALLAAGRLAFATANPACRLQAVEEKRACVAECKEDYRAALFRCRNVDPACGNACLAGRERCLEPFTAILDGCVDGCRDTLQAAKARCQQDCNGDQGCLDACIDQAQIDAFVCRDNCRESFRANEEAQAGIKNCRAAFRACVGACPPL
jgi:hypothetical protein